MVHKSGQLGRADVLLALAELNSLQTSPEDGRGEQNQAAIAQLLSFDYTPPENDDGQLVESEVRYFPLGGNGDATSSAVTDNSLRNPSPTAQLRSQYWQLLEQKNREGETDIGEERQISNTRPVWRNKPERMAFPALMSADEIRGRLLPCLRQDKVTRRIDMDKLVHQLSRAEFVTELPLHQRCSDTQALQIIDDRQVHLMPYWLDHSWVTWHVREGMADYRLSRAVIEQGGCQPQSISKQGELFDYQLPPEGSTVLLLSDLGVLAGRLQRYQALLDQLAAQDYHIVVLTPCHAGDYPAALRSQVRFVSWADCEVLPETPVIERVADQRVAGDADNESAEGADSPAIQPVVCPRQQWAETLLMLCSVAVRLEPELLRAVRLTLNEHLRSKGEKTLPASAESFAWQHRAVSQPHCVAATVDEGENRKWRDQLAAQPLELKRRVFNALRRWRVDLPDEIWFEEFLTVERCTGEAERAGYAWFADDLADTAAFLKYVQQRGLAAEYSGSQQLMQYQAWVHRAAERITHEVVQNGALKEQLQACLALVSDAEGRTPGGHVLDPKLSAKMQPERAKQSAWLCQLGNQLVVTRHDVFQVPQQRSSLIARLDYREPQLNVVQPGREPVKVVLPERLGGGFVALGEDALVVGRDARLETDLTVLWLAGFQRPDWAKRCGRDAYGLFAELAVPGLKGGEVIQRFRWIPAGVFMMGSPESEAERYSDEDYYQVTLTKGYWLADTAVTQELWETVTEKNPANFLDNKQNPVEKVSWDDAEVFIKHMNQRFSGQLGGLVIRLPAEAEWEHACRAGTTTPFSFGENITSEQVNFNGQNPYNRGAKSEYCEKTIGVNVLPPNQWGLYAMHGNVWEWCVDVWKEQLGINAMTDPYHSGEDGNDGNSDRVQRGGSWADDGRRIRSAYRSLNSPDDRYINLGLRLALSYELNSAERKVKGTVAQKVAK